MYAKKFNVHVACAAEMRVGPHSRLCNCAVVTDTSKLFGLRLISSCALTYRVLWQVCSFIRVVQDLPPKIAMFDRNMSTVDQDSYRFAQAHACSLISRQGEGLQLFMHYVR
jgi:hypothetical protein